MMKNNKLNQIIAEATEQVLNEISFEKGAAAYKKASDMAYNATSPSEKNFRTGQAERLRQHLIDKYNKRYGAYGVKDDSSDVRDNSSHVLKDIGYNPKTSHASAETLTTDSLGGRGFVHYDKYTGGDTTNYPSYFGGFGPLDVHPRVSKLAQRGEHEIENVLSKLKRESVSTVKLTESDLHNIIKESVKNVLLSEGMQWLGDFTQENVGSLKEMLEKQNGGSFNLNGIDFTIQPTQRGYHASSGTDWGYDALRVYDALRGCWQYSFHKNRGGWQN